MKKDNLQLSFAAFRFLILRDGCDVAKVEVKEDASKQLLDIVFSKDPFTRLPNSDVALFLSKDVDPSIREFISQNLMSPISPKSSGVPDEFSDVCFDLIRGDNESALDYASRVESLIQSDSDLRAKLTSVEDIKTE